MKILKFLPLLVLLPFFGCSSSEDEPTPTPTETMYFPNNTDNNWETKSIASLGWNQSAVQPLKDFWQKNILNLL